jgi:DNA-binding phage protein
MKIRRVLAHEKKRAFIVQAGAKSYEVPFSTFTVAPSKRDPLISVSVDRELGGLGFSFRLKSGKQETMLLEQVLEMHHDPEVARKRALYDLTCLAQDTARRSKLTKRAIARRLGCAPTHLYRLLDQTFYGKTIDQMVKLLSVLGVELKWRASA